MVHWPEVAVPQLLSCVVERHDAGGSVRGDDDISVGGGGGRAVGVGLVGRLFAGEAHVAAPEQLSAGAVEAQDAADGAFFGGAGDEDAVAADDRG